MTCRSQDGYFQPPTTEGWVLVLQWAFEPATPIIEPCEA
jgi:hypothetical protein